MFKAAKDAADRTDDILGFGELSPNDKAVFSACVHKIKNEGKFYFVFLRLSGGIVKTVLRPESCLRAIDDLREGMYIYVSGAAVPEFHSPTGTEINITDFIVVSAPEKSPVIPETAAEIPASDMSRGKYAVLRNSEIAERVRYLNKIKSVFRAFMEKNGFIEADVPILSDFSELPSFDTEYFGKIAYLASSPQLSMTACTAAFDRCYSISHSFSSKRTSSPTHLSEFTGLNFQMGYIEDLSELTDMLTEYLRGLSNISELFIIPKTIPSITFSDVQRIFKTDSKTDINPTEAKKLCRHFKETEGGELVFVTDFPEGGEPFYAEVKNGICSRFELYFDGVKIARGSKNIHDCDKILTAAKNHFADCSALETYFDVFRAGIMPFGGVEIYAERLLMKLLSLKNIRLAALSPRDVHHTEI